MGDVLLLASKQALSEARQALQGKPDEQGIAVAELELNAGDYLPPCVALQHASNQDRASRILIADLRCAAALARLRQEGYLAERAGNRVYGGDATADEVAALSGDTLLEQLDAMPRAGYADADAGALAALDASVRQAQAWQRDGWAGLSELGCRWDEALQQWPHQEVATAKRAALEQATGHCELDDLILAAAPVAAPVALADLLQAPWPSDEEVPERYRPESPCPAERNARDYKQAQCAGEPVALTPVLLLRHQGKTLALDRALALEYLAPPRLRGRLARMLQAASYAQAFDLTLTVGRHRCRLEAKARPGTLDRLVNDLLEVALVTGRPLLEYDCTLYLPLDLATDKELEDALLPGQDPDGCVLSKDDIRSSQVQQRTVARAEDAVTVLKDAQDPTDPQRREKDCDLSYGELARHEAEAQALLYFLPALQKRIFDTRTSSESGDDDQGATPIEHWSLKLDCGQETPELQVDGKPNRFAQETTSAKAALTDVSLYRFYNGLCVLALHLGFTKCQRVAAMALRGAGADWWHALLMSASDTGAAGDSDNGSRQDATEPTESVALVPSPALQIERWLWLTKSVRLLRPAFAQQRLESKLPEVSLSRWSEGLRFRTSDPFSPIVARLLHAITGIDLGENQERRLQIRDDRMFVNVAYALAGPPPSDDPDARDAFERLFSLALYVDHAADGFTAQGGYVYDQAFVRAELDRHADRRWQGVGSLYGSTNYSQVALGFGSYFAGPVARVHVPLLHGRMLLLALFYELTLCRFDRLATVATRSIAELADQRALDDGSALKDAGRRFSHLQRRFIRFTNDHWFRVVTSQTQGMDTYRRVTAALGLDAQYALVKDKLERSDQYLEQLRGRQLAENAKDLSETANRIARGGRWIALVALLISMLAIGSHDSMLSAADLLRLLATKPFWASVKGLFNANWNFVALALVVTLVALFLLAKGLRFFLAKGLRCAFGWLQRQRAPRSDRGSHGP